MAWFELPASSQKEIAKLLRNTPMRKETRRDLTLALIDIFLRADPVFNVARFKSLALPLVKDTHEPV